MLRILCGVILFVLSVVTLFGAVSALLFLFWFYVFETIRFGNALSYLVIPALLGLLPVSYSSVGISISLIKKGNDLNDSV